MNLTPTRLGLYLAPTTPVWTGTAQSYTAATFTLTVTTTGGAFSAISPGLALRTASGRYARIKTASSNTLVLAETPLAFTLGDALSVGPARLPFPRYQRIGGGVVYKDYDVAYPGAYAALPPAACCTPAVLVAALNTPSAVSAAASAALAPGASIASYAWNAGAGGSISGSGASVTVTYTTAGFRYLTLTVTDTQGTAQARYIPVWAGSAAFTAITAARLAWRAGGWQGDFSAATTPDYAQRSPVALVDLDTAEVLFYGWLQQETARYDFERATLTFQASDAWAYSQFLYAYPFQLERVAVGAAAAWHQIAELDVRRALWVLLRWHANLPELANFTFSEAERAIAGQVFPAGTLRQQAESALSAAFWEGRAQPAGSVVIGAQPLYRSSWSGYTPQTLAAAELLGAVECERSSAELSEARLSGVYWSGSAWTPLITRAPSHPEDQGQPGEVGNLAPVDAAELRLWAGRHLAQARAPRYRFQPRVALAPASAPIVTLPGDLTLAVDELTLTQQSGGYWQAEAAGRPYGDTPAAADEPPPPAVIIPPPALPPLLPPWWAPLPLPEPLGWPTTLYVFTREGGVYYTDSFTPPESVTQPVWAAVNTGLEDLRLLRGGVDAADPALYQYALGYDASGDQCVYRRVSGGSWTKSLTRAMVLALTGGDKEPAEFCANATQAGQLAALAHTHLLRSTDYGATWSATALTYTNAYGYLNLYAAGNALLYALGGSGYYQIRSQDGGGSWARASSKAGAPTLPAFSPVLPTATYAAQTPGDNDLAAINWSGSGNTVLWDSLNLLAYLAGFWLSPIAANWQRVLRCLGSTNPVELLETLDSWGSEPQCVASLNTAYRDRLTGGMFYVVNAADAARAEWDIIAAGAPNVTYPHHLYALDQTNTPDTLTGRAGVAPGAAPYTDSIPYTAAGVCEQGLQIIA